MEETAQTQPSSEHDAPAQWLAVSNTEAELASCVAAIRARQRSVRPSPVAIAIFALLAGLLVASGMQEGKSFVLDWLKSGWILLIGLALAVLMLHRSRRQAISGIDLQYEIRLDQDGFSTRYATGEERVLWPAVEAIERRSEALLLHLKGSRALWISDRSFDREDERLRWQARLETLSGLIAAPGPAKPVALAERRGWRALCDLVQNLWCGALSLVLSRRGPGAQHNAILQIALLAGCGFALSAVQDLLNVGLDGQWNIYALPAQLVLPVCALCCAWLVAQCSAYPARIVAATIAVLAPMLVMRLLYGLLLQFHLQLHALPALSFIAWAIYLWAGLAAAVALVRVLDLAPDQRLAALLGVAMVATVPYLLNVQQMHVWTENYADSEEDAQDEAPHTSEAALFAQPELLRQTLDGIREGKPGKPELYLLALGGYGEQDVFLREVESVEQLFKERFSTEGHSVVLVNNPATALERPFASTTALRESLQTIGSRMNPEEDVLFLFMTSHGAADHEFSLNLWPFRFDKLTPETLRKMLDDAKIRNRVILVSACYSGGFIEPLASAETLVMSASREDRNSHGCSHGADWTFFGKAYFDEALRQTRSFEDAFALARQAVTRREDEEKLTHSEPQIAAGPKIRNTLTLLERALSAQMQQSSSTLRP